MEINHPKLTDLLQRAYSAEKAAAFAYQGHAGSIKNEDEKKAIRQVELDEWKHRDEALKMMQLYSIPVSRKYEIKFHIIGKTISSACYVIGWFMPYYFAGRLESGNVCEYFVMMHCFHELGIYEHDQILYEMAIKEKEHEALFLEQIKGSRLLPFFEKLFNWGKKNSFNDVSLEQKLPLEKSDEYCRK